ncbi:GumC family protein [Aromatoleum bremense]|uniref:non-specific protein-tyrosine kinase n=1 Tax=Aromatoleum bremense TaxID=76115 RepID=A0ABX1NYH1_9RHOO|nr:polysaccharide biosynthesis tyrosine autokinase [Aromatoleum bremense]NMG17061.1 polysaccharide biosynthesis tyrosine autokinase [Aromatoleum bremense]
MDNTEKPDAGDERGQEAPRRNALIERRESTALARPTEWRSHVEEDDDDTIDLRAIWDTIVKRKWTVITFFVIVMVSVLTATFLMTPIYRASLTLQIERQEAKVLDYQGVTPNEMQGDTKDFYETQYELLKSRSLAQRVIDQLNLGDHPVFAAANPSLLASIKGLFVGEEEEAEAVEGDAEQIRKLKLTKAFLENLTIEPVRNSRLVKIHFDSPDPVLASRIVNAISEAFINVNLERRMDASSFAKVFLEERLQQLKMKLGETEKELVAFAREEQIVRGGEQEASVDTQVMQEFTTALAKAQQERIRAEAMYQQLESGSVEGIPQVLENKVIQEFKGHKAKLETEYQENLKIYKPGYPKMVQLQSQIDEMQAKIAEELAHVRSGIRSAYQAARSQEAMLQVKMDESKRTVLGVQDRSIQYNILKREVDTNRQLYDGLLQRYKEVGVAGGVGVNNVSVVDKAEVPLQPFKPKTLLNALIAALLGLFGGIGLALLFEHLDDTIKDGESMERLLGLPVLGLVPLIKRAGDATRELVLEQLDDPRSGFSEAYRSLRTAMQFSTQDGIPKVLMVTSASMGEGKSTTALALAINLSQMGAKVLLLDADLRKASMHRKLGLANTAGLTNYLAGDSRPVDVTQPTPYDKLFVITSGPLPPNPAELLGSAKMVALLDVAKDRFDCVIVDGPPVLGLADAPLLGSITDATVVVVEAGGTRKDFLAGALKRLRSTRTHVIGGVLTKIASRSGAQGYYYNSYYQYGGDTEGSRSAA